MGDGFNRVAIIGFGLIGSSIAAGLKKRGAVTEIGAWDQSEASLATGKQLGYIDHIADDPVSAAQNADIVVISVPVNAIADFVVKFADCSEVLTDVGSVKGSILNAISGELGSVPAQYVPGHPIAGSERHGVEAANPDLFQQHRVILTPLEESHAAAVAEVQKLWRTLGAEVVTMTPDHHDDVLAQTSHLPHLLAYALVDVLSSGGDSMEVFEHAAGGFRDFSRIAASDPVMWRDVFQSNPEAVLKVLRNYMDELTHLEQLIRDKDGEALQHIFERAKKARDHFSDILAERDQ